jgi:hypothetical protein
VIAHVGGVPLEEMAQPLINGGAASVLVVVAWFASRVRRQRSPEPDRPHDADGPLV